MHNTNDNDLVNHNDNDSNDSDSEYDYHIYVNDDINDNNHILDNDSHNIIITKNEIIKTYLIILSPFLEICFPFQSDHIKLLLLLSLILVFLLWSLLIGLITNDVFFLYNSLLIIGESLN